jgi:hypothetical protein
MADKLDTSPEEEAIKDEAREFMTGLVGSGQGDQTTDSASAPTAKGADINQELEIKILCRFNGRLLVSIQSLLKWCTTKQIPMKICKIP